MEQEIFATAFMSVICICIAVIILMSCYSYRLHIRCIEQKEKLDKLRHPASYGPDMTIEDVKKFVEDAMFWETFHNYLKDKKFNGEPMKDSGYVEVLEPCATSDCPAYPTREDCCTCRTVVDGKEFCRCLINLNNLCGVESNIERPNLNDPRLLTQEEIDVLAEVLTRYNR